MRSSLCGENEGLRHVCVHTDAAPRGEPLQRFVAGMADPQRPAVVVADIYVHVRALVDMGVHDALPEIRFRIARLKSGPLEWSLRVQLFLDEATTPIEDASVEWPEDKAPFREIGRVVIPQQDVTSARGQEIDALVESLSFDPWHSVEALRPLGAVMRARSAAYRESTMERKAAAEPETVLAPG